MVQGEERRTFPAWDIEDFAVHAETLLLQPLVLLGLLEPTITGEETRAEGASADLASVRLDIRCMKTKEAAMLAYQRCPACPVSETFARRPVRAPI